VCSFLPATQPYATSLVAQINKESAVWCSSIGQLW